MLGISENLIKIFIPILNVMEKGNCELNENEFIELSCKLYDGLNFAEKNLILNYNNAMEKNKVSLNKSFSVTKLIKLAYDEQMLQNDHEEIKMGRNRIGSETAITEETQ